MGNTLIIAGEWTSVDESVQGRLEVTSLNQVILEKISKFVLNFPSLYPKEAFLMFHQPIIWKTNVHPSLMTSYLVKKNENLYFSEQKDESKRPWLIVRISADGEKAEVKAFNFEALAFVLRLVGDADLIETKTCLEANPDPLKCILGPQFSETYQTMESPITNYLENALCTLHNNDNVNLKDTYTFLIFAMILKEFDVFLMKDVLSFVGSTIKLTPHEVDNHFNMLSAIIESTSDNPVLKNISWMSPFTFVFENGCRAPLWRQMYGDIAYIVATTTNNSNIFVTASTSGYFVNKRDGFLNNDESDFERNGPLFASLILLLKNSCNHFKENIDDVLMQSKISEKRPYKSSRFQAKEPRLEKEVDEHPSTDTTLLDTHVLVEEENRCLRDEDSITLRPKVLPEIPKEVVINQKTEVPKMIKKKTKYCKDKTTLKNPELESWLREYSTEESDPETDSDRDGPPEKTIYNYNVKPRDPKFAGYWHIQNMFQFIKTGGHPPTLIGLCSILDMDLSQENVAMSIVEANGVEVLVNILEVNDFECQIASLKILIEISRYRPIWQCILNFGGIEILIDLLHNTNISIRCLAAECLGAVAKTAKARQLIRHRNGLFKLVSFLDTFVSKKDYILGNGHKFYPSLPLKQLAKLESGPIVAFLDKQWKRSMHLAKSGAIVLSVLSNSKRARKSMQLYNVLPYLSRHLKSTEIAFLRSVVKIIAEFAKESQYRSSILSENMIPFLVQGLNYNDAILTERICIVFFRACEDEKIRNEVRKQKGLISLHKILVRQSSNESSGHHVMKAVTGAISKLCLSPDNVHVFSKLGIIQILIPLMKSGSIKVLLHVLASLIEILKIPNNRIEFNKNRGLQSLLSLQSNTIPQVLILVNYALAQCAEEKSLINTIIDSDGVRLLWSLLTHPSDEVKASAAWAIAPCIQTAQDSGYMVRSLVGGLEILVKLLKSNNVNVLAAVCATIANVVHDEENLGILTEFKVCYLLSKLLCAQHYDGINKLKATLSEAIAQCCRFGNNRVTFGREDVIVHLVKYLDTDDLRIQRATAQALYQLSLDPDNIIKMHAEGCIKPLLKLIGSDDESIQEAASRCISNIRNLAFANNKIKNKLPVEI